MDSSKNLPPAIAGPHRCQFELVAVYMCIQQKAEHNRAELHVYTEDGRSRAPLRAIMSQSLEPALKISHDLQCGLKALTHD